MPLPLLAALGIGAGANIGEGIAGSVSSSMAAKAQMKAAEQARGQIENFYNQAVGFQQPYFQSGTQNLDTLNQRNAAGDYSMQGYDFQADPGYQWQLEQGTKAMMARSAAQGTSLSGATLRALQRYGQGLANQAYGQAYTRAQKERQRMFENQYNLANMGQQAANQIGQYTMNTGQNVANTVIGAGNARAAGIMGVGNAIGNTLEGLGQSAMNAGTYGGGFNYGGYDPRQAAQSAFTNTYGKMPWE